MEGQSPAVQPHVQRRPLAKTMPLRRRCNITGIAIAAMAPLERADLTSGPATKNKSTVMGNVSMTHEPVP